MFSNHTNAYFQREIYKTGNITNAVRVLIGPDESTLAEHNIKDGDVLNILIEPEKMITVHVFLGFQNFKHQLSHCTTVSNLKQILTKEVRLPPREFELLKDETVLDDDVMPLHYYGVQDGSKLRLEKTMMGLVIENRKGEEVFLHISKISTIGELRTRIMKLTSCGSTDDFSLFVKEKFANYRKLDGQDDVIVGHVLREHDKLYLIDNKFVKRPTNIKQSLWQEIHGIETGDTILNIKLRAQDQLGYLTEEIKIQLSVRDKAPDKGMGNFLFNPMKPVETCTDSSYLQDQGQYQITYQPIPTPMSASFRLDVTAAGSSTMESSQESGNKKHSMFKGATSSLFSPLEKGENQQQDKADKERVSPEGLENDNMP